MASLLSKASTSTITAAANANKLYKPAARPVALFFGGTSGIGEAMATQLARQTGGRAHIVLMGRNEEAAQKIISGFPKVEGMSSYSLSFVDSILLFLLAFGYGF